MKNISIGKYHRLRQCSTMRGVFSVLALDHRNNLRKALNSSDPEAVTYQNLVDFKQQVIKGIGDNFSAVLLDPEYGAGQSLSSNALTGTTGLLIALEASGYLGEPTARNSRILEGWSVEKISRLGASAVKLLVYYHPSSSTASNIERLVQGVAEECETLDIPLFLEILTYSVHSGKQLSPEEYHQVVIEGARKLTIPGVDVLKIEFPHDIQSFPDEKDWERACKELTGASAAPWILLSASVDFETFLRQVQVACRNGASGVAVGRAVWKEATHLDGEKRFEFLSGLARMRMKQITSLCDALAKPWTEVYQPQELHQDWFKSY